MAGGLVDMRAAVAPVWRDTAGRFEDADEAVDRALYEMGQVWGSRAVRRLQVATPRRTGRTAQAWRADYVRSERAVKVSNKRATATFLLRGTRPHNIPNAFGDPTLGGSGRFAGMFHPGQRPDEQLVGAWERCREDAQTEASAAGVRIVRRLIGQPG